jgi:predicted GNAT superfamily acetyltransferase
MSQQKRSNADTEIGIRPIKTLSDLRRCHEIQRAVWGYSDLMVFPYTILISMQHNGGVLLGAYVNDQLVGFVAGYLGMAGAKLYLFSQRMGVLPEYQSKGLGYRLKVAQREQMLRHGVDIVVWTYDPLEGRNASLNIEKLGGIVRSYARDIYGYVQNPLQTGLTTDRFFAGVASYERPRAPADPGILRATVRRRLVERRRHAPRQLRRVGRRYPSSPGGRPGSRNQPGVGTGPSQPPRHQKP